MTPGRRQGRRRRRLSRSGDFDRAYRDGRSHANRYLVLYAFPRPAEDGGEGARLGVSVGRKVGGAAERNRVKRALREGFWSQAEELPPRHDFVLVARSGANELIERQGSGGLREPLAELVTEIRKQGPAEGEAAREL